MKCYGSFFKWSWKICNLQPDPSPLGNFIFVFKNGQSNIFFNDSQILGNFCTHISLYIGPVVDLSLLLVDGISTPFLSEQVLGLFKCHQKIALRTLAPTSPCFNSYISPLVFFINYEFVLFVYFKHSQMKYSARNKQYLNC